MGIAGGDSLRLSAPAGRSTGHRTPGRSVEARAEVAQRIHPELIRLVSIPRTLDLDTISLPGMLGVFLLPFKEKPERVLRTVVFVAR